MITKKFEFPLIGESRLLFENKRILEFVVRQLNNYEFGIPNINKEAYKNASIVIADQKALNQLCEYMHKNLFISRNFCVKNERLNVMGVEFKIHKDQVVIYRQMSHNYITLIKRIARSILNLNKDEKYKWMTGIFYSHYLIPIYTIYALCYGFLCVHGSLVKYENRVFLFTGLDGVGKSSIGSYFANNGGEILADNIVLFDGTNALNFNIAMRIDSNMQTKYSTLYDNGLFKEILPDHTKEDICKVDNIFYLIKTEKGKEIQIKKSSITMRDWIMCVNSAPEINQANYIMSPARFLYEIDKKITNNGKKDEAKECIMLYIPEGKIEKAGDELLKWL